MCVKGIPSKVSENFCKETAMSKDNFQLLALLQLFFSVLSLHWQPTIDQIYLPSFRFFWMLLGIQARVKKNLKNGVTVAAVFRQTLAKHPQKAAFIFEDKTWTFQDVEDYSNRIANYFKSQGYKKGEAVALFLESCPEFVCLWLGLSKLGVITALVNTNLRLKSLKHCITVAESKAIIYGSNLAGELHGMQTWS